MQIINFANKKPIKENIFMSDAKNIEARKKDILPFPVLQRKNQPEAEPEHRNAEVDFSKRVGEIKPVNGVGNGPVTWRFTVDKTEEFKNMGIPYSRLHDTEGQMGSGEFVNIHCIFKNFDADVNDPASYNFAATDAYLKCILNAGTKIFYRLGETIENNLDYVRSHTFAPKDPMKWAQICEHIIRHYNEGWADGYHMGIEYWEIWNEPEGAPHTSPNWSGSRKEFFELYRITANHLKKCFPNLKIGGFASTGFYELGSDETHTQSFIKSFFDYITAPETSAPIDFFSWHFYGSSPERARFEVAESQKMLESYNLGHIENIVDEWNYQVNWALTEGIVRKSIKGAAFVSAMHCVFQKSALSKSMYYDAEVSRIHFCGLFNEYTMENEKPYLSFIAFNQLRKLGYEVYTSPDGDGLYSLAASDGERCAVMLVNYETDKFICNVSLKNADKYKHADMYLLDENNDLERISSIGSDGGFGTFDVTMPKNSIVLLELR